MRLTQKMGSEKFQPMTLSLASATHKNGIIEGPHGPAQRSNNSGGEA